MTKDLSIRTPGPLFDGPGIEPQDVQRLGTQLEAVRRIMRTGRWVTLAELAAATGGSEAGVSARLRDLRKPRFGSMRIDRRRVGGGLFEYRMQA